MNDKDEFTQKRRHFRVAYPLSNRPQLLLNGEKYDVVDISEQGIKYCCPGCGMTTGGALEGVVEFPDGETFDIEGKALRVEVILQLRKGIPYTQIVKEQMRLIKEYRS